MAEYSGCLISAIASGSPRSKTSRSSCGRSNKLLRGVADGFELPAGARQRRRHVLGALPSVAAPRAGAGAISDRRATPPSRDSRPPVRAASGAPLDEGEILLGERQDRDFREIDLLLRASARAGGRAGLRIPRRRRSAPAPRWRARRSQGGLKGFRRSCGEPCTVPAVAIRPREFAAGLGFVEGFGVRAAGRKRGLGAARAALLVRPVVLLRQRPAFRPRSRLQCRATSQPAAAGRASLAERPGQRSHRQVVAHEQSSETQWRRESPGRIIPRGRGGALRSLAANRTWAVIAIGTRECPERGEVGGFEDACVRTAPGGPSGCRPWRGHGRVYA